ncbi:hypothetical protein [Halofilum ochraceum]|uniref:hypothetical protein n=1 Tax=Halofilum ochraceum TaxID=1611323 RepID=UPI0008D9EA8E|nr:hypothetical protein [Halofilum ochraceum]
MSPHTLTTLTCPKCESDRIVHTEYVLVDRDVRGYDEHGRLWIDGNISPGDDGEHERLHCKHCGHDWPLPDDVDFM